MANMLKMPVNMRDGMPRHAGMGMGMMNAKGKKVGKRSKVKDDEVVEKKSGIKDNEKLEKVTIAPGRKGLLHKNLGINPKKKIPLSKLKAAAKSKNLAIKKRAQFALNFRKTKKGKK